MSKLTRYALLFLSFYFEFSLNILILAQTDDIDPPHHGCDNSSYYNRSSSFERNLNRVLANLPLTNSGYGFLNSSSGQGPDVVSAIALCRGDIELNPCGTCVNKAIGNLTQVCPNQKEGSIFYNECMVTYSNENLLGRLTEAKYPITDWRSENVTAKADDVPSFTRDLLNLLNNLTVVAAGGGSLLKYAADTMTRPNSQVTYGVMQCTPDLSKQQCTNCLKDAVSQMVSQVSGSIGVQVYLPKCNMRYEDYRFYGDASNIPQPDSPPPDAQQSSSGRNTRVTRIATSIILSTATFMIIVASVCTFAMYRKKRMLKKTLEECLQNAFSMTLSLLIFFVTASWECLRRFPIHVLNETLCIDVGFSLVANRYDISIVEPLEYNFGTVSVATNNFSEDNKIGQGGFGLVYKGKLEDGRLIAVKRLLRDYGQGEREFKNEVLLVAKLHHRNLVGLLGFCIEGSERVLIYELMPNASLDKFLFDPDRRTLLDWDTSYNIIEGVARGLLYLHEDSRLRIVHRDLKCSNILLDAEMNAKITDFGMARLFSPDETQGNTSRIVGTYGYMAPEYVMHGEFSVKLDVFSFGVLVLEIITGQANQSYQNGNSHVYLLSHAWRNWRDGTASNIIDPILLKGSYSINEIIRSIHIALLCVQKNVADRPTMSSVVLMFNSFSLTLQVPKQPAFFIQGSVDNVLPSIDEYDVSEGCNKGSESSQASENDATISEITPR
ncbi:cysteine-rich receptor-like protein kinase 28 [Artemisia annua]|uniref:Cysteine-rich receptor-like protein kinase 28 n=1 Tax=Artemisia annua TaxID=35608 RepID=A0A2U1NHL4_ARTAN|nr:cysteine-rich receptor-like protein kinase 28 [Artemisia annua]